MKNQVQLITYVDRLAKNLKGLTSLLQGPFAKLFGGVHLLPFFTPIDGSDAGFDPIDHTEVDARLGDWNHVRRLSEEVELMADLIVNHISNASPQFKDFSRDGSDSQFAGMFLTYDRIFPKGATEADLLHIYRPRPGLPFTNVTLQTGEKRLLWTTFTPQQIDIDVQHPEGERYLDAILRRFQSAGIRIIRLDAVGYAIKKAGTSCFMIPETFRFIGDLASRARTLGIEILVEIHSYYRQQIEIARQVDWIYDFALPPLVLHSLFTGNGRALGQWLQVRPNNCVTVLDTHDGIGVIDVGAGSEGEPGLLTPKEINTLVETIHARSNGESLKATGAAANNLDLYQVNCTYYDALGRRENEYLLARAVQFFVPGIPQVYYVGLLATTNDMELLARSQVGRDINRHYYTQAEIQAAVHTAVVEKLFDLIRLRNTHPSFAGQAEIQMPSDEILMITWTKDDHWAKLAVDFAKPSATVTYSTDPARQDSRGLWEATAVRATAAKDTP
ncbi:MAG: sucrose phosphorylase [Terriglobia bacterium]|nr:sucrose phosphorylase [Terriglobia bacterium]